MAEIDKLKILEDKIKALNDPDTDGNLTIKVATKDVVGPSGIFRARIVCTMVGGHSSHVANPELWLPRLMGGGRFVLSVFAPNGGSAALVDNIDVDLQGEPRAFPDLDAAEDLSTWKGPRKIIYPTKRAVETASSPISIGAPPPLPHVTNVAAPQTMASGVAPGVGVVPHEEIRRISDHYTQQISALNQRLIDEQHKREMDARDAQHKQDMARLEASIKEAKSAVTNVPAPASVPKTSLSDVIKELTPLLAPVIVAWQTASADRERRQEERDRRAEERQTELIKVLATPKPVIDPILKEFLDAQRAEQLPAASMIQQIASATSSLTSQMIEVLKFQAEVNAGPEEQPIIKVVREVGSAIQGIAASAAAAPRGPRKLPSQQPPPPSRPAPQPAMHGVVEGSATPVPTKAPPPGGLEKIRSMLLELAHPESVAEETVKAFRSEEFQQALTAANREPMQVFVNLVGEEWLETNRDYAQSFVQAFIAKGTAAGIFEAETEDEVEEAN